jgi:hypothetical protein
VGGFYFTDLPFSEIAPALETYILLASLILVKRLFCSIFEQFFRPGYSRFFQGSVSAEAGIFLFLWIRFFSKRIVFSTARLDYTAMRICVKGFGTPILKLP